MVHGVGGNSETCSRPKISNSPCFRCTCSTRSGSLKRLIFTRARFLRIDSRNIRKRGDSRERWNAANQYPFLAERNRVISTDVLKRSWISAKWIVKFYPPRSLLPSTINECSASTIRIKFLSIHQFFTF